MAGGQSSTVTGQVPSLNSPAQFPFLTTDPNPDLTMKGAHKVIENNAALLKPVAMNMPTQSKKMEIEPIPIKKHDFVDGIPMVKWTDHEVNRMNIIENLNYAVVGKFSYGWPELAELREQIPKQCGIKGECKIGFLRNKHILMRFSLFEDFVNIMAKNAYYIVAKDGRSYQMRPLIYDANFKMGEETTQAMAWISFPDLLPTFFCEESPIITGFSCGKASTSRHDYNK